MDTDLASRLERIAADQAVGAGRPEAAVPLACDLLVAGFDTPALRVLAGESTDLRAVDAQPLIAEMLTELGVEPIEPHRAFLVIARDVARQMISGTMPAEYGASWLWSLWTDCDLPEAAKLLDPLERWQYAEDDQEAIRAEMRGLAADVVRAVDDILGAGP